MAMRPVNWTCPYCGRPQVATDTNFHRSSHELYVGDPTEGPVGITVRAIACLNPQCKRLSLDVYLRKRDGSDFRETLGEWQLLPESSALPQPDFIPQVLRDDYYEACRIHHLSPKASATLSRRCLQGMIRDFCKIAEGTLAAEINKLDALVKAGHAPAGVLPETVEAIDHVRSIGNIGAHMEKDINVIVDVEPDEAQSLIHLIEMLFQEWYAARDARQKKLARVAQIAKEKKEALTVLKTQKLETPKKS